MKTVGIIGGSGYTGGELMWLVINHPALTLDFVYSSTRPGTPISDTHQDLLGQLDLAFTDQVNTLVDGGTIVSQGESTIIDFINGELKIIREGSISKEEIENIL